MASPSEQNRDRPSGTDWTAWVADSLLYANSRRPRPDSRPHVAQGQLRVSDTERNKVAEALSRHYGEGRLDHEELNERLQAAMAAKTRGDLEPLLADLPPILPPAGTPARRDRALQASRRLLALAGLLLVLAVILAVVTAHHVGALVFIAVALALVARRRLRRKRRATRAYHAHLHVHGTPHWHGPNGPVVDQPHPIPPSSY